MEKKRKQTSKGSAGYLCVRMLECSLPNKVFLNTVTEHIHLVNSL